MTDGQATRLAGRDEISRLVAEAKVDEIATGLGIHRDTERFAMGMRLDVTTDIHNPSGYWPVTMHNISDGGFAFWSRKQLRKHAEIWVREFSCDDSQPWVFAHVEHCTVGILGYLVGGKFEQMAAP